MKDVPDSYVKWMINYSEGEMQFWQAEQMRRKLMVGTQDGTPLIIEMTKAVAKVLEESGKLAGHRRSTICGMGTAGGGAGGATAEGV